MSVTFPFVYATCLRGILLDASAELETLHMSQVSRLLVAVPVSWHFWALWGASTLSNLADGVFKLVLPVMALTLTREPLFVAGVTFALTLPWLLLSLPIGVLVDRRDRRKTLQWANILRVVTLFYLTVLFLSKALSLPLLYLAALALGIAETVADTASGALLPSIVPKAQLERANARLVGAQAVTNEFLGPPLGGVLAGLGLALATAVSASLCLVAVAMLVPVRGIFQPTRSVHHSLIAESREGLHYIWQHRLIRTLTGMLAVLNCCWSAFSAVLVLYVISPGPFGLTTWQYGVLLTGVGLGGVLGTVMVEAAQRLFGRHRLIAASVVGTCVMLLVPAISHNPWSIGAAAVLAGSGTAVSNVMLVALRQRIVPEHLLGRVGGALRMVSYGALTLGAALAGLVAQITDVRVVFASGAVAAALLIIPVLRTITPEAIHKAIAYSEE
jgi:MFS family permease